jgi:hypothetical protein
VRSANYTWQDAEDILLPVPYTPSVPQLTVTTKLYLYSSIKNTDYKLLPSFNCTTRQLVQSNSASVTMLAEVALKFTVRFTYASESSQFLDALSVSLVKGADSHTVTLGDSG